MNTVNLLTVTKVVKLKYPDCVEKTLHCVFAKYNMYHKCNSETRSMILDFFEGGRGKQINNLQRLWSSSGSSVISLTDT